MKEYTYGASVDGQFHKKKKGKKEKSIKKKQTTKMTMKRRPAHGIDNGPHRRPDADPT